jgi:Secretion system C-terminal sorting domain
MHNLQFIKNSLLKILALLLPAGMLAQSMHITGGARVVTTGTANLVFNNIGLVNDGSFVPGNSTVAFTGAAPATIVSIGGTTASSFNNVTLNKIDGDLNLNQNILIKGTITLTSGNVQLNAQTLDLGSTGRIAAESNKARITDIHGGRVSATGIFSANVPLNPGNIGAELQINGTNGTTIGPITIVRMHTAETLPGIIPIQGIQRSFTITNPKLSNLNARLRFFYLDIELNGNNEALLSMFTSKAPGSLVTEIGKDSLDLTNNIVTKLNINPLAHFTIGSSGGNTGELQRVAITGRQPGVAYYSYSIKVYPNPAQNSCTIQFNSQQKTVVTIQLYDQSGRLLEQKKISCMAGTNNIPWNLHPYAAGIYYLSFDKPGLKNIKISKE